ncbi:MAG: zinc ribbon domain-containing protein [Candidatus Bathyarchaeia archaeon]
MDPNYTSQICPKCGHRGKGNWRGYIHFECVECGYGADRDRVASLNLALRAARRSHPRGGHPSCNLLTLVTEKLTF